MIHECENCGGNVSFSPKDKGNVCERCGSVFPVNYDYEVKKKDFSAAKELSNESVLSAVKSIKCDSCGANMVMNKKEIKSVCPYCGSSTISELGEQKVSNIDAIVPFDFNKEDALIRFNDKVSRSFFANKKIFKGITKEDFNGVYVNAFVYDLNTNVRYKGEFSYTERYRNSKGESKTRTRYKKVSGTFDKLFNNITVEANSNLNQNELMQILPYDYSQAVKFDTDFTHGYTLESNDEMFEECFSKAEDQIRNQIKKDLLKQYRCDRVESLDLDIVYTDKKYNHCLLPVYFINKNYKDKNYKVLMNGRNSALSKLPKNPWKILMVALLGLGFIAGIALIFMFSF